MADNENTKILLNTLTLNPKNPRFIKDDKFVKLCKSIKDLPDMMSLRPIIVDNENLIIGGNMRYRALKELGYTEIPAEWVKSTNGMTPEGIREFVVKDNLAFGEWDFDLLANEYDMNELIEMGMDESLLDVDLWNKETDAEKLDDVPEPQKDAVSKLGDIFVIDGKHRVMCGDSTIKADVGALMAGKRADMVFTDIPYGIDYSGGRTQTVAKKEYGKIKGDADQDISLFVGIVKENGYKRDAYMCVSPINLKPVFDTLDSYDGVIVWKKNSPGLGYQWIRRYCEFIIFTSNRKKTKRDDSEFDYWDIATDAKTEYVHGTQKPVKLPMRAINFSSVQDDLVADWFLGSGSTLIASQQTNRICYGMELDPIYIDVILRRYKNLYPDAEFKCENRGFNFDELFNEK